MFKSLTIKARFHWSAFLIYLCVKLKWVLQRFHPFSLKYINEIYAVAGDFSFELSTDINPIFIHWEYSQEAKKVVFQIRLLFGNNWKTGNLVRVTGYECELKVSGLSFGDIWYGICLMKLATFHRNDFKITNVYVLYVQ